MSTRLKFSQMNNIQNEIKSQLSDKPGSVSILLELTEYEPVLIIFLPRRNNAIHDIYFCIKMSQI